ITFLPSARLQAKGENAARESPQFPRKGGGVGRALGLEEQGGGGDHSEGGGTSRPAGRSPMKTTRGPWLARSAGALRRGDAASAATRRRAPLPELSGPASVPLNDSAPRADRGQWQRGKEEEEEETFLRSTEVQRRRGLGAISAEPRSKGSGRQPRARAAPPGTPCVERRAGRRRPPPPRGDGRGLPRRAFSPTAASAAATPRRLRATDVTCKPALQLDALCRERHTY
ncbi:unnamed protein product, partial [Prorocentrum cordatum]